MNAVDAVSIPDLSDPKTFADGIPHAAFARIRERPRLYWQPTKISTVHGGYWAITRSADIRAAEMDVQTFTSTRGAAYPSLYTHGPIEGPTADAILSTDPPRHTKLRLAAAKGFSPAVVKNFDPWIREIVREQIDRVKDRDSFDFVVEFAQTIPSLVIARIMGAPREQRAQMVSWVQAVFDANQQTDGLAEGEGTGRNSIPIIQQITHFARDIQDHKRKHPAEDMFTVLSGCVDRGEITQSEFEQWMFVMMGAGYETTHTAIGQMMRMYLEEPDVHDATDRALAEGKDAAMVSEYVRLISPVIQMARMATRDMEFAATQIRKDDVIVLYYPSANRDAAVYAEPDRFNPWRTERGHMAFGTGIHNCLGLHVANLEIQILWQELKAAGVRLRLNGVPKRGQSNFINQLRELPVARA